MPNRLLFFNRLKIDNFVYQSKEYTRVIKRNSCSVKYLLHGQIKFGQVLYFVQDTPKCICKEGTSCICECTYTAFILQFEVNGSITDFPGMDNFLNVTVNNIHRLRQSDKVDVVGAQYILALCVDVFFGKESKDSHFFCEFPNMYEFD